MFTKFTIFTALLCTLQPHFSLINNFAAIDEPRFGDLAYL